MIFFQLPRTFLNTYKYIECVIKPCAPKPIISQSLSHYLCNIKEKIDDREKEWDIYKKYTNPCEYINSVVPNKRKSVSKYKPLSRSYFKMIEILSFFKLTKPTDQDVPIRSFHLAEGPGGFIEAISNFRQCKQDEYIGISLVDENNDPNIPGWKKSEYFLNTHSNVFIEAGADGTGDILSTDNFVYCTNKYKNSMDVITADGGFDFSMDFNSQEIHITKLLFAQVCYALTLQKKGGSFVLKVFDCFMQHTVDILYILSSFYDKVYLTKPQTSRYANSEKYVVCKGYLFDGSTDLTTLLFSVFQKTMACEKPDEIHGFLTLRTPLFFLSKLQEFNSIFGQQQIEIIHYTISLIENKNKTEKIENMIKLNVQKCVNWCIKYNVMYNSFITKGNQSSLLNPLFFLEEGSKEVEVEPIST